MCLPGFYRGEGGICEPCQAGTFKPASGNDLALCFNCPAGFYSSTLGADTSDTCQPCPVGTYGEFDGASGVNSCQLCPEGTYSALQGLPKPELCSACPAGYFSSTPGLTAREDCEPCPVNTASAATGNTSADSCIPCSEGFLAGVGSSECTQEAADQGTLVGLYLLIAGIIMVVLVLIWVFASKHCSKKPHIEDLVHMKLDKEMKDFIFGQQFWISLFSCVEVIDLMSDLGAYASLLYAAALTGWMKIIYTVVVAFAIVASLHGVHTRAHIILDMQEERMNGLTITGNDMLYYEKQFNILQIMANKRSCKTHVPFDRGNKYLSHHLGVQRLISLNSMRIVIAVFEDVPFLGLNLFLLLQQPDLAANLVFMMSFVISIFVLGYKTTLLEKHARLQIRKWHLEAKMDTDTMLNKKAARGRRLSWTCEQCNGSKGTVKSQEATPVPSPKQAAETSRGRSRLRKGSKQGTVVPVQDAGGG
ncbi:unnamed protein product [Chrysoparadoxa australica]